MPMPDNPQTRTSQGKWWRFGLAAREAMELESFELPPQQLRCARVLQLVVPVSVAALLLINGASPMLLLVAAEVLLVAAIAWAQLRQQREGARRFALALSFANMLFLLVFAWLHGSPTLMLLNLGLFLALLLLLGARLPVPRAIPAACFVAGVSLAISFGAGISGRVLSQRAVQAYVERDWPELAAHLERLTFLLEMRGASESELALVHFRHAEALLMQGTVDQAIPIAEELFEASRALPVPTQRDDQPAMNRRTTLAWQLANQHSQLLLARCWQQRYGRTSGESGAYTDPLAFVTLGEWDRIGWCAGLAPGTSASQ